MTAPGSVTLLSIRTLFTRTCVRGDPGHVTFKEGRLLDLTLPGSEFIGVLEYIRKGNRLSLVGSDWTMELRGDTLFFTACDHRHVYLRVCQ